MSALKTLHPNINDRIFLLWGTKSCREYMMSLLVDDRGNRQGFNPQVASEIYQLIKEHDRAYPQFIETDAVPFLSMSKKIEPVAAADDWSVVKVLTKIAAGVTIVMLLIRFFK